MLLHGLSLGESPGAIQNLGTWTIEAHHVIPVLYDGQAVGNLAVAVLVQISKKVGARTRAP